MWDSTVGYYIPNVPNASPFAPGLAKSPAVGAAVALPANTVFDISDVDDDPYVKYDITGRLRPTTVGLRDIGCFQSGTSGVVLNYPRNVFNTGVPYRSSIIGKPTTAPTAKPAFSPPTLVPTVAPSKPTKVPTKAPIVMATNAEHKAGEKVKDHGSPEEAPAPVVVPPTVAAAEAEAEVKVKVEEGVQTPVVAKKEKVDKVEKVAKVAKVAEKKTVPPAKEGAKEEMKEEKPSAVQKVASSVKAFVAKTAGKMESSAPVLRTSKFVETASTPTKSPSTGIHKPTWKPSSKPAERRD